MRNRRNIFCPDTSLLTTVPAIIGLFLLLGSCATVEEHRAAAPVHFPDSEASLFLPAIREAAPALWYGDRPAACSITFDDGTLDQYLTGARELDLRGLRGTFFVITGRVGDGLWYDGDRPRRLFGWDQARELAWKGHEIAGHSAGHVDLLRFPERAATELRQARDDLRRELPWHPTVSFGWPYWRSAPESRKAAARIYAAARAGGIGAVSGDPDYGGVNGPTPVDFMRIGARGILPGDDGAELLSLVDEVTANRGWVIPNFHGIDDGTLPPEALGWAPISLAFYSAILDELMRRDIWIAPFGEVAAYVRQRDDLEIVVENSLSPRPRILFSSDLDESVYRHPLTLRIVLSEGAGLDEARLLEGAGPASLPWKRGTGTTYLIEIPPGSGTVELLLSRERRYSSP